MKALECSRCGGVELVAEGDHYVCKHCGTILVPEEGEEIGLPDDEGFDSEGQAGTERLSRTHLRIIFIALGVIILALAICLGLLISLRNSNRVPASESEVVELIEGQLDEQGEPVGAEGEAGETGADQVEPSESEGSIPEARIEPAKIILPGNLTKEYSFQGITFMIDPSWELEYEDWWFGAILHGMPVNQIAVLEVFVFQHGQASTLDGFLATDNYGTMVFEQRDSWEKDGMGYRVYSAVVPITGGEFFLLLCSQGQTGFAALFSMGSDLQNEENYALADRFFHSMSFDPTQVTLDAQLEESAYAASRG